MAEKNYAGQTVNVTDEGYLEDMSLWSKEIAEEIAKEEGIELNEKHYALFDFLRNKVDNGESLTIRSVGKSGICDIKEFYKLFPGGPLKLSSKYAGIPKPASCI